MSAHDRLMNLKRELGPLAFETLFRRGATEYAALNSLAKHSAQSSNGKVQPVDRITYISNYISTHREAKNLNDPLDQRDSDLGLNDTRNLVDPKENTGDLTKYIHKA